LDDGPFPANPARRRVLVAKSSEILEVFNRRAEKSPNFPNDSARHVATTLDAGEKNGLRIGQFRAFSARRSRL
jgi:hypothetical protein